MHAFRPCISRANPRASRLTTKRRRRRRLQVVKKVAKKVAKKAVKKAVKKAAPTRLKTSAPDVNIGFQQSLPFPLGQIKEAIEVLSSLPK